MDKIFLFFLLLSFFAACAHTSQETALSRDCYAHINHPKAKALIKAAIEQAGGWDNWHNIRQLSYQKSYELYTEAGSLEQTYRQEHSYKYEAPKSLEIQSIEGADTIITYYQDGRYRRKKNGRWLDNTNKEALAKAMNASTFVIGFPFNLLDPGIRIEYLGQDTLYNGREVEAIAAHYDARAQDNRSSSEPWIFYFAIDEPYLLATLVDVGDHYSLVENLSFSRVGGLLWPRQRKSYRANAVGDTLYLRANYWYDNWQVY